MNDGDRSLEELLHEVSQASPNDRIDLRDDVARRGLTAMDALSDWFSDPELCRFALRTIGRTGQFGEREAAIRTLISGRERVSPSIRDDIDVELRRLDHKPPKPRKPSLPSWARTDPYDVAPISASAGLSWPGFQPRDFQGIRSALRGSPDIAVMGSSAALAGAR